LFERFVRYSCFVLLLGTWLSACAVEGGVPEVQPTTQPSPLPQATSPVVAQQLAERNDSWNIGLLESPGSLYPYQPSPSAQRVAAPVTELLYPSPILALNYGYTTTGVLEQVPTLENGGATLQKADVHLDAAGNITTTETSVITQVDQLVVTYRWNPDLHWSDGQPVTAADSVFAYNLAKTAPPNDDARDRLAQTVSYEKVDDHTTRAILRPDVTGPTYFLNYWTPLPEHVLKNADPTQVAQSDFALQPIGYGPYAITSRTAGAIKMVRNPYYTGRTPSASQVSFTFPANMALAKASLMNGNLDVVFTDRVTTDQLDLLAPGEDNHTLQVSYMPNPIWEHIDFNLDETLLQDIRIRHAIALGTNRKAMVDTLFKGHVPVLDSWVLPGQPEAAPADQITRYAYDPDQARALLDQAGFPEQNGIRVSSKGVTLTLQLLTTDTPPLRQSIAEQFKKDMASIGVQITIQTLSTDQMFSRSGPLFQRQYQLALFGWAASPYAGGLSLWSCASVPSESNGWSGENVAGWCFRDADRAIREGVSTLDVQGRRDAYITQQKLWTQELPALPLFQRLSLVAATPAVHGLQPDAFAPLTWNITAWQREEKP
jgi:peptide/nickel transport system substrate-binding protein